MAYRRKKKNNTNVVITSIILVIVIILSSHLQQVVKAGSNITNTIFKPLNELTYSISSTIMEQIEMTVGSKQTRKEVERLKAENQTLLQDNAKLKTTINRKDFLKAENDAINNSKNSYIKAKVINTDVNSMQESFHINKGLDDGIKVNDVIVQAIGDSDYYTAVVGKVIEVNKNTSKIETIKSSTNDVAFVNSNSGDYGVIDYFKNKVINGYMLDIDSIVEQGDILLTSGLGGVYPQGLYIGTVGNISMSQDSLRKNITVNSPVDFTHLYRVLVLQEEGGKDE
ncbi:MAG: rod shape-determining protein MreC [Peptoniphilaceae bacterium]|nr:rod shape-determining protein MreC [Peptoniphilaceae bacterium]MDY6018579.1 rod shape-determining protein MreC [Anaerococcus sp.]